ncbi:DNA helicase, SNF2/RAD54 family domain protein [Legionella beliardensis]|uniref:DNA helicase, SNF2/RAD54 family domain protein n=1 Tax=Legionella beliardensis TaxID=91822 RepID=A0A378I0E7_9GAMM|nr:DEAD/DEAH box helicase [Legionella beliardensis]STX28668.1 DNA helicase, SNF2/RAD54 family domain protein [Legionella beliardensis]
MLKDALSRMADVFLPTVLMHGLDYQKKGFVLNIRLSEGLLKARVKDPSSQIYDVHIDLKIWPKQPARCSCQAKNCKHAAASLFALQAKEKIEMKVIKPAVHAENLPFGQQLSFINNHNKKAISATHDVVYLLETELQATRVTAHLALARRLKSGRLSKKIIFHTITESRKQFFTELDDEIITTLALRNHVHGWFERLIIPTSVLLQKILLTRRAYFKDVNEPVAFKVDDEVTFHWQLDIDGTQHLIIGEKQDLLMPILLDKLWYYNEQEQILAELTTSYQSEHLKWLLSLPPVSIAKAHDVAAAIDKVNSELPKPKIYENKLIKEIKPIPILILDAKELEIDKLDPLGTFDSKNYIITCDLLFDYRGIRISGRENYKQLYYEQGSDLIEINRDFVFEQHTLAYYESLLLKYDSLYSQDIHQFLTNAVVLKDYSYASDIAKLHAELVPILKNKGWFVEFNHDIFAEEFSIDAVKWYSEFQEQGNDFFSYQLGILVEGKPVNIIPLIAKLIPKLKAVNLEELSDEKQVALLLPQQKRLQIPLGRIKPLLRFLLQYVTQFNPLDEQLKINHYQLMLMYETEQAFATTSLRWQEAGAIGQKIKQLMNPAAFKENSIPQGLTVHLRDYQQHGLAWLQSLRRGKFGGVLADDMGLGKTIQTLAHLQLEKEQGRMQQASLIIAPTSIIANWYEEAKRCTPNLRVLVFHGSGRQEENFDDYDLIVSTYSLIQRDKTRFTNYQFYYCILDEAQFIKNARAKVTQIILQIKAHQRLCLSGTPLENHLGELWSLFHFLIPGLLGDGKYFRKFFRIPIEKNTDEQRHELLMARIRPFMLRRTKNQVAKELPPKVETTLKIELVGAQRDLYETIRISMQQKVQSAIAKLGLKRSHIILLDALLKLRQVCCDPRLVSINAAEVAHESSAKLDALMTLLDNLIAEKRRILVFSQFTSMIELIEEKLVNRSYDYLKLTGQTINRLELVNKFQEGHVPIFLISLKAGGVGLNLTQADTVIHYDPWWNPAVENQATDRSHRIGQKNTVFVYKLITVGTVEEVIVAIQNKKKHLFEGILNEKLSGLSSITEQDIEQFFLPLKD